MGKKAEKIGVKFRSSNKRYYIWISSKGKISIDSNFRWILEENKLKNINEKIFIIMDALKDRQFDISSIKKHIGSNLYHKLNLDKSNDIRMERISNKNTPYDRMEINENSLSMKLYKSNYNYIINKVMLNTIGMDIKTRILVKTARAIVGLIKSNIACGFDSMGFTDLGLPINIKINLIPDDNMPVVITESKYNRVYVTTNQSFKYPKYSYEININKSWYFKIYLKNKAIIKRNKTKYILLKTEEDKNKFINYVISKSKGYSIKVKRIVVRKNTECDDTE
ncbi:MAG: hypothetical protein QXD03_03105 [Candidatus Anstonellales archaeon]